MNYSKLKSILNERKIIVADFCQQLKMTRQGLQKSLNKGLLPYEKILLCCRLLDMSPNEFFEWGNTNPTPGVYASNISGINTQNSNEAIQALREQLKEKGGIIKEKDKQINRLLTIIERNKLK